MGTLFVQQKIEEEIWINEFHVIPDNNNGYLLLTNGNNQHRMWNSVLTLLPVSIPLPEINFVVVIQMPTAYRHITGLRQFPI